MLRAARMPYRAERSTWGKEMIEAINANKFESTVVEHNVNDKWLIAKLARNAIPAIVTSLGAGVKRITHADHVCPKCKGDIYLTESKDGLICDQCKLLYEIKDDSPIMLIDEAKPL